LLHQGTALDPTHGVTSTKCQAQTQAKVSRATVN